MTYQGYMALANDEGESIELVNAARVKAYTDNLAPSLGLRGCDDCEGLDEALGETYTDPVTDNAPWYDPTDPATADFYGVYPLGFEGIDDSTRTIESAELTGDGSVVVGSRSTGKDIRVTGVAFAKDEAALYAGVSWMESALNGTEEGRCFGDRLSLYSSCPPIQVLPPDFAEPYEMDLGTGTVSRTNVIQNPRASNTGLWAGSFGTGGAGTETASDLGGVLLPNGDLVNQYMRYTWTTGSSGGSPFVQASYPTTTFGASVPIGTQVAAVMYVRTSIATTMNIRLVKTDGSVFASAASASIAVPANTWTKLSAVLTTTVVTNSPIVRATIEGGAAVAIGTTFDATAAMATIGSTDLTYFDGNTTDTASFIYGWVDETNDSSSVEIPAATAIAEAAQWTTTSGVVQGTEDGIRVDWDPGDPEKVACREITGLIPGEQYQLRMRLENFGDYYVRLADTCATGNRVNLAPNPRMLDWSWQGGGVSNSAANITTGGPLGLGYRQAIATSSNTSSPFSVVMPASEYIPVTPGTLYQGSAYIKAPVGTVRLSATFRDSGGVNVASDQRLQTGLVMDNTWQRMSGLIVAPPNAATMEIFMSVSLAVGAVTPNMEFGAANVLIEHPNYDILRTNLQTDPRAVGPGSTSWSYAAGTGGAATSAFITSAVDGPTLYGTTTSPTYKRNTVTTAPSGGSAGPFMNTTMPSDLPDVIEIGERWVAGAWFRSNRTVSGTARYRVINDGGIAIDEFNELGITLTAGVWQYISGGKTSVANLINPATIQLFFMVGGSGGAAAIQVGDIYETTGGLGQVGSSDETYFDSVRPASGLTAYIPDESPFTGGTIAHEVVADPPGPYFDGFTEGFQWDGQPNNSTSSSELGIDYETVSGSPNSDQSIAEPIVLDFIPRTDSIFLSITPTQTALCCPTVNLEVQEALVRRIPRPGVIAFGTGHDVVPPSDGWTHVAPATAEVTWIYGAAVEYGTVRTDLRAPFTGGITYLASTHGIERTLFGMIPGNRYRLMIDYQERWGPTDGDPGATLNPIIALSNTSGAVATVDYEPVPEQHFTVIEFTADATSSVLSLRPNANLALGSFGYVSWQIDEYLVEEILQTDTTEPQPGRFQERTMYEVKASQGPIITNVRTSPCGVMGQVTYSLRAGNPFKYRSPIFAGGLPTGTSQVVADTPCTAEGLAQIVNFAYNPSLEANATDWAAGGVNVTSGRSNLFGGRVGDYAFQATAVSGSGEVTQVTAYYIVANVTSGPVPLGGETITVSVYVRTLDLASLGVYPYTIFVTMAGFPSVSYNGSVNVAVAETWYRIEETITLPANVALEVIETTVFTPVAMTTGGQVQMDALMIQRGDTATEPFDQTIAGVTWTGDVNTSALALTPTLDDISEDPDCPTPPAPPAPPLIDDACIADPTSYNRTVVNISADTVPRNLTAYPLITLTAGSEPVRQARIRFWENPDNLTIDQLDLCSYDGEIIVSYLADGATMVIDGVLREATVTKPGFAEVNANHVLYGPDGGPVDWPELSGGIPYLVTLELDSAADYTDTLMTVDLVVRD